MVISGCGYGLHLSFLPVQVAKQWYDFERHTFHFVQLAKKLKAPLSFRRVTDFDDNGILYWVGSNGK